MQRNTAIETGDDGGSEGPELRLTVDVAGRRLVYGTSDLESIGFSTSTR